VSGVGLAVTAPALGEPDIAVEVDVSGDENPAKKWDRGAARKALTAAGWDGNTSRLSKRADFEEPCRSVGIDLDKL
jgi:hypothetical protein